MDRRGGVERRFYAPPPMPTRPCPGDGAFSPRHAPARDSGFPVHGGRPMRILAAFLAAAAALPAAAIPEPSGATARIRPSAAEEAAFVLSAQGVHVFECKPG